MSKKLMFPFVLIMVLSMLLSACATPTAAPTMVPTAVPTAVPTIAPTKVPPTATPEPALDFKALFAKVVADMPAEKGYGAVTPAALNTELADKAPFLLDIREASEYEAGFIKGAVNVPVRTLVKNLDKLPAMDQAIVIYCATGHRGGYAAAALRMLGYTNVRNLGGGITAWSKAALPTEKGKPADAKVLSSPKVANQAVFKALDNFLTTLPDGFLTVKTDKLNEQLAAEKKPFLLDVRTADEFAKNGYIKGSVNIVYEKVLDSLDKLPAKDQLIVVICASGHRASIIQMALRMMGYTNSFNLAGGINTWKTALLPVEGVMDWTAHWTEFTTKLPKDFYSMTPAALNTALADKAPFLLDVREASEIETAGYIKGAVAIPVRDVLKDLSKLPALDKPIVIYCASGHRAAILLAALRTLGYTDVKNLGGGLSAWVKASLPVEKGTKPAAPAAGTAPKVDEAKLKELTTFVSALPEGFFSVSPANLNIELGTEKKPFILDVRTAEEVKADGFIKGSVIIPINELFTKLDQLPKDKTAPIVVVCKSGHRGGIALIALRMAGYTNVRNVGGGLNAWVAAALPVQK